MTAEALALVAAAALVHAGWNALAKAGRDPFAFLWWSVTVASLAFLPAALYTGFSLGDAWPFLTTTVAIHAAYFYTLGTAPAGYVVATRELSIVASVVIGWAFLGEHPLGPRLARASLIVAGAALCAAA